MVIDNGQPASGTKPLGDKFKQVDGYNVLGKIQTNPELKQWDILNDDGVIIKRVSQLGDSNKFLVEELKEGFNMIEGKVEQKIIDYGKIKPDTTAISFGDGQTKVELYKHPLNDNYPVAIYTDVSTKKIVGECSRA